MKDWPEMAFISKCCAELFKAFQRIRNPGNY